MQTHFFPDNSIIKHKGRVQQEAFARKLQSPGKLPHNLCLKSVSDHRFLILHDSAHSIEFALQIPKKSGRVPRSADKNPRKDSADFFDFKRQKVSEQELSDDFGTTRGFATGSV